MSGNTREYRCRASVATGATDRQGLNLPHESANPDAQKWYQGDPVARRNKERETDQHMSPGRRGCWPTWPDGDRQSQQAHGNQKARAEAQSRVDNTKDVHDLERIEGSADEETSRPQAAGGIGHELACLLFRLECVVQRELAAGHIHKEIWWHHTGQVYLRQSEQRRDGPLPSRSSDREVQMGSRRSVRCGNSQ